VTLAEGWREIGAVVVVGATAAGVTGLASLIGEVETREVGEIEAELS
jgi:hypothetical protein